MGGAAPPSTQGSGEHAIDSSRTFEIRFELPLAHFTLAVEIRTDARVLGVFGPSGSGKTSLLETVAGWRRPRSGRIAVAERVLFDGSRGHSLPLSRRGIGYVPQDLLLLSGHKARANILLGPRADARALPRVAEILELEELLDRDCNTLSGGERQRVALARALCSTPSVLVFDEPLGSLDVGLRSRILPYLLRVRDEFLLPTLFVSHDPTEMRALCDEVVVLERGRVVGQGKPAEVLVPRLTGLPTLENVFGARVEAIDGDLATARIAPGASVHLGAKELRASDSILVSLAADDILVSTSRPSGLSARNCLEATVRSHGEEDGTVWMQAEVGSAAPLVELSVALTPTTFRELCLADGMRVFLVFKASACRVVARPSPPPGGSRADSPGIPSRTTGAVRRAGETSLRSNPVPPPDDP